MEDHSELNCIICFEYFTDPVTLYCGHTFCKNCIVETVSRTHKCPICSNIILDSSNF